VSEWRIRMKSENLPMRQSIVLSCLTHKRVNSFIHTGCIFSDVSSAALVVRSPPGSDTPNIYLVFVCYERGREVG
jgi:hypothetical protein